jgi:hypothetical protein
MLSGLTLIRSSDVSEIVRFSARTAWQLSLGAPSVEVSRVLRYVHNRVLITHSLTTTSRKTQTRCCGKQAFLVFPSILFVSHSFTHARFATDFHRGSSTSAVTLYLIPGSLPRNSSVNSSLHVLVMPAHGAQFLNYRDKIVIL